VTLFESWSSLPPGLPESVALVTQTTAVVQGTVFDDRNHDLVWSGGDLPMAGVLVTTVPAGIEALTSGSAGSS